MTNKNDPMTGCRVSARRNRIGAVCTRCIAIVAVAVATTFASPLSAGEPPRVVATIRPLHGLVAGVMAGIGEPYLLVAGGQSPHHFALAPSGARQLEHAGIVFVIGAGLMPALDDAVATLAPHALIVDLSRAPGVHLLHRRTFQPASRTSSDRQHDHEHGNGNVDPHFWLDPENAKAMVYAVSAALAKRDSEHAAVYAAAAASMTAKIDRLTEEIGLQLRAYHDHPFFVFHDAFQYFEVRFGLGARGAIAPLPETRPGAQHLRATRQLLSGETRPCVFGEPGTQPGLLAMMVESTHVKTAQLDPIGRAESTGPQHYFAMMRANAAAMAACFSTP